MVAAAAALGGDNNSAAAAASVRWLSFTVEHRAPTAAQVVQFRQSQQVAGALNGTVWSGAATIPAAVFDQLRGRNQSYPVQWTADDLSASWLSPGLAAMGKPGGVVSTTTLHHSHHHDVPTDFRTHWTHRPAERCVDTIVWRLIRWSLWRALGRRVGQAGCIFFA